MKKRIIGDFEVIPLGMGCWAIGGEAWDTDGNPIGWGKVDDSESIKAIHAGLDAGLNFIDTANVYGAGHSEEVIGKALEGKRENVILASKFGNLFNAETKVANGSSAEPADIMSSCEESLKRLNTDYIDLYQFHLGNYDPLLVEPVLETLEILVSQGKIRSYGWSTDFPDRAAAFTKGEHCVSMQYQYNLFRDNREMVSFVEEHNLTGINRGPLAMGLLSGKYGKAEQLSKTDIRRKNPTWLKYFNNGVPAPEFVKKLDIDKEILTSSGRSTVQGALAWILAKSLKHIPIPGFRNVQQIQHNAKALEYGPLDSNQLEEIERLLKD